MNFKKAIAMGTLITLTAVNSGVHTFAIEAAATTSKESSDTKVVSKKEQNIVKLTLKEAIDYALEHNKDISIQDIKIEKQQFEYDQNMRDIRAYNKTEKGSMDMPPMIYPAVTQDLSVNRELHAMGAVQRHVDFTLNQVKLDKEKLISDITNNVSKAYYDLLLKQEEKNIAEENFKLAQDQYNKNKLLLANGQISEHQLLLSNMAVTQAKSVYEAAKVMYQVQLLSFNNVLGIGLDTEVVLLDKIENPKYEDIDLEKAIKQALDNNSALKVAKENYEIQKIVLKALSIKYPSMTYKYKEQEIAIEEAYKNMQSAEALIEMGLRSAHFNLSSVRDNIEIYQESIKLAEKSLEIAELNYELGMNTTKEVTEARISLMESKKAYMNHLHQYHTALINFQDSMGLTKTK